MQAFLWIKAFCCYIFTTYEVTKLWATYKHDFGAGGRPVPRCLLNKSPNLGRGHVDLARRVYIIIDYYIFIYMYLEPKWPWFWLEKALFWGGWPSKIGVIWVPGIWYQVVATQILFNFYRYLGNDPIWNHQLVCIYLYIFIHIQMFSYCFLAPVHNWWDVERSVQYTLRCYMSSPSSGYLAGSV